MNKDILNRFIYIIHIKRETQKNTKMAAIDAILGLVGSGMGIFSNIMNNQTLQYLNTQSEIHEK